MEDVDPPVAEDLPDDIAPNFDVMRTIYGVGSGSVPKPSGDHLDDEAFATMRSIFDVQADPTQKE
jgi:hypothetical protein